MVTEEGRVMHTLHSELLLSNAQQEAINVINSVQNVQTLQLFHALDGTPDHASDPSEDISHDERRAIESLSDESGSSSIFGKRVPHGDNTLAPTPVPTEITTLLDTYADIMPDALHSETLKNVTRMSTSPWSREPNPQRTGSSG